MSENVKLIGKKLEHLARMRAYLDYSTRKMQGPLEKIRAKGHVPVLLGIHDSLKMFVERTYGSSLNTE